MNETLPEFQDFYSGLMEREPEAISRMLTRFEPYLLRIVRRRLNVRLRTKVDSIDVVQSVWASFFRVADRVSSFDHSGQMLKFLITIARNKVMDEMRRTFVTAKRALNRETSLFDLGPDENTPADVVDTRLSRPAELADARDHWRVWTRGQPKKHQRVMELRAAGATYKEISDRLGIHERSARKIINRLIDRIRITKMRER